MLLIVGLGQATHTAAVDDALPAGYDSTRAAQLREQLPEEDASTAVVLFTGDVRRRARRARSARCARRRRARRRPRRGAPADRRRWSPARTARPRSASCPCETTGATATADAVGDAARRRSTSRPRRRHGPGHRPAGDPGRPRGGLRRRRLPAARRPPPAWWRSCWSSPTAARCCGWSRCSSSASPTRPPSVLATQALAGARRAVGRVDDRHPLGARLRRRHRLRAAADLALPRRAAVARGPPRGDARSRCGVRPHAVLASATTVVLGVLCLALSLIPTTRGLGIACAVGHRGGGRCSRWSRCPATLVLFGRWVFWPQVPHVGSESLAEGHSLWRRVGDAVEPAYDAVRGRHPAAARGARRRAASASQLGLPTAEQFLQKPEAISAGERAGRGTSPPGSSDPAVGADPRRPRRRPPRSRASTASTRVTTGGRRRRLDRAQRRARGRPRQRRRPGHGGADARRRWATLDGRSYVGGSAAEALDARRRRHPRPLGDLPGDPAAGARGAAAAAALAWWRPVLLVLTVLGTYVAALGASWWLFTGVFGFSGVDEGMPLLAFLFLVALGRRLQHLPGHPRPGRRRPGTAPARACCARWPRPAG